MAIISYAQNQEDVLLHRVFGGQETGFYVDVGAYHPVRGSVTKAVYDRGWSGINIEPGEVFAELAAARGRDVNLRMAVLDRTGETGFRNDPNDAGMSHVLASEDPTADAATVPCDTLENIIAAHGRGRPVDFIKIDAEGAELAIIRSTDWRRLRPRLLLVEATLPWSSQLSNQDWEPILLEGGYQRVYFDGINCFYLPEELLASLGRHFTTPVNVLDRAVAFDPQIEIRQAEQERLGRALVASGAERDNLAASLRTLQTALESSTVARTELAASLAGLQHERETLRGLLDAAVKQHERADMLLVAATAELDRVRGEAQEARGDRDRLSAALAEAGSECSRLHGVVLQLKAETEDRRAEHAQHAAQAAAAASAAQPASQRLPRQVALLSYRLVRPVLRPIVWRLRGFMTEALTRQIVQVRDRVVAIQGNVDGLHAAIAATAVRTAPSETTGLTEMRSLAETMEHAILSLAAATPLPQDPARRGEIEPAKESGTH